MGYRGEDLDLRTPQTWSAAPADLTGWSDAQAAANGRRGRQTAYRSGPIWVDETVLACSNHAYDVALAHRAGEVRLEHLLHALTRIDAAAEAMEARGVRVAALRRESATIIASEIPVGLPSGAAAPRRSDEFEEVLRLSSANALRRNAPAGVDDVLHVLFDLKGDLSGLDLLNRHAPRAVRDLFDPPAARGAGFLSGSRLVEATDGESHRLRQPGMSSADGTLVARVGALEHAVRGLINELTSERKAFATLLGEIQRDLGAQRDERSRVGIVFDRVESLEQLVRDSAADEPRGAPALDLTPIGNRLEGIEEALLSHATGGGDSEPVLARIDALAEAFQVGQSESARTLADRIAAIELQLTAAAEKAGEFQTAYTQDLSELHEALAKLNANQHTLAGAIDRWHTDTAGDIGALNNRIEVLVRDGALPAEMVTRLSSEIATLNRTTADRNRRRSRFRNWLFGTDDWIAASWPSQVASLDRESVKGSQR